MATYFMEEVFGTTPAPLRIAQVVLKRIGPLIPKFWSLLLELLMQVLMIRRFMESFKTTSHQHYWTLNKKRVGSLRLF